MLPLHHSDGNPALPGFEPGPSEFQSDNPASFGSAKLFRCP